jgi:rhamnose utilization protein RhaD (predicted bifunctional aldolase and dehydrogenase)/NAD(P)-dependent dehydrogenase (short-subunit alcohol dehydrogenase family)
MEKRWSDTTASEFIARYGEEWGEDLALRTYTSRLIGAEEELVLHGGGNTSVKGKFTNILGQSVPAIFVKASGYDLADIEPDGHTALDLVYLQKLRNLPELSEAVMADELQAHRYNAHAAPPSIEALMHAFIPATYIDHTHADAILSLTNRPDGEEIVRRALGDDVTVLKYVRPGFDLAKAVADAYEAFPEYTGMVFMKHGLLTWGETARESYERTIELVTRAEEYLARGGIEPPRATVRTVSDVAMVRFRKVAPIVRGLLALGTGDADWPYQRFILHPLITDDVLNLVDSEWGKEIAVTPPLTSDHLIRIKPFPLWIDEPDYDDENTFREQATTAIHGYGEQYDAYYERYSQRLRTDLERLDARPRVILMPGLGAICVGRDAVDAGIVQDIVTHTLAVKARIAATGSYEGLHEEELFDMEYYSLQHAKLHTSDERLLQRSVALVTGAAGAIGSGVSEVLLDRGCHVAISDVAGEHLTSLESELRSVHGPRVLAIPLDVTDPTSVAEGFSQVIQTWGGIDIVVANAGIAHVSSLADMEPEAFQRLERVNIEGTLYILSEVSRHFRTQGTGGDVILISTKNVFAPGATFGAYSATKAAAHQLARIASLELAEMGVRVNMVSPDAVFSHGTRGSGLWAMVGPDRMRARGLDEKGLEEYYQKRNLLKARVTATHVANAVLFFVTHQTPTTGATIPVDGGLPDSTPR